MINHGTVKDSYEAAFAAIQGGCDMDMESRCYKNNLAKLVADGKVDLKTVDEAVKNILKKKFELGLFDDPYRFCSTKRQQEALNNPEHAKIAREVASASIVLLKNKNNILPLSKNLKTVAFIGPLVKPKLQNKGFWDVSVPGVDTNFIVSQWEGLKNKLGDNTKLLYAKGCNIEGNNKDGFKEAIEKARLADVVILSIGERRDLSGEAKSRSNIVIPGVQEELFKELLATGKPIVVLINAGRPLVFNHIADHADAILYTWWLGSEAGNAIADVLFGDYNPSAKLTMTFPLSVGQIPIYYNHLNTGRPANDDSNHNYNSSYLDLSIFPKYEFGYGLSYSTFEYSDLKLSKKDMKSDEIIEVCINLKNTGKYQGSEIVQLYIRDKVASLSRPVKELKDFAKVSLKPGETKTVKFMITNEKLSFYNSELQFVSEPGEFDLMIGASSRDIRLKDTFNLLD